MMVLPSEEQLEMFNKLYPWYRYEKDTDYIYLADNAPEDVKELYPVYVEKYGKGGLWRPLEYGYQK